MNYVEYYTILKSTSGVESELLVFVLAILVGIVILFSSLRRQKTFKMIFVIIWLIGFTGVGLLGFGSVYYQHNRCQYWLQSGDYQIVEGKVTSLSEFHQSEQFSVNGVHFEYSPADLSVCGFRKIGSPLRNGLQVRVTYKNGSILKLEIADNR